MVRLDAWASESQYLAHLAPVWLALPEEVRGTLYVLSDVRLPPGLGESHPSLERGPQRPSGPSPALVASWGDLQGVSPAPVVLLEHGAGQAYSDADNGCYSGGGGRDRAVLFVVPSAKVAGRNRRRYPDIPNAVVGCPKMDRYHVGRGVEESGCPRRAHNPEIAGSNPVSATRAEPVVAVSFHWHDTEGPPERRSAYSHYEPVLAHIARAFPGALGHAHPRWINQLAWPLERAGFELVRDFDDVLDRADVYVCDNSSSIYEFASLDKPVVVLNAPWYRRDVDFWPRFWECADVGVQCDEPDHLVSRIDLALADTPPMRANRHRAIANVYAAVDGHASQRAADAIVRRLAEIEEDDDVSTTNPFEASPPSPAAQMHPPLAAPAHPPVPRMKDAGATDAEVAEASRLWSHMSEEDRWQATDWINSLSNAELAEQIEEGRRDQGRSPLDSVDPPEGTFAEVRAWIGSDPRRARDALAAERRRERVRSSVTDYAQKVIRDG